MAALVCGALAGVVVFVDRVAIGPLPALGAKSPRPKQIPVSPAACADVPALHNAARDARAEMLDATAGVPWRTLRTRLDLRFIALNRAIEHAAPDFPEAIRRQFTAVRRDIALGRRALPTSKGYVDLMSKNGAVWSDAVGAFGSASDLVGSQCGTPLGASEPLFGPCSITKCTTP
jgi:hypothetical protein